jgi:Caspase domain
MKLKNNRIIYTVLFAFFVIFHFYSFQLFAGNLHAIIVADTNSADIRQSVEADVALMREEIKLIAQHTGLQELLHVIKGKEAVSENLINLIQNLSVKNGDVIFFYFSGHGYRTPSKQKNSWPNLFFSLTYTGMDFGEVTSMLANKNPRLFIAIADCCNNSIPDSFAPPVKQPLFLTMRGVRNYKTRNYRKLFLRTKGQIIVSSSKDGELAWGASNGAIFTLAFLKSLHSEVENVEGKVSWQTILDSSILKVHTLQTPQYQIIPSAA